MLCRSHCTGCDELDARSQGNTKAEAEEMLVEALIQIVEPWFGYKVKEGKMDSGIGASRKVSYPLH